MATYFKTTSYPNIGTALTTLLTAPGTSTYTIIGLNLSNTTDFDVIISITVIDPNSNAANYINGLLIPPYTSAKVINNGEKLVLAGNSILKIISDTANSVDAVISYAEII
jgi:hypothetical protein